MKILNLFNNNLFLIPRSITDQKFAQNGAIKKLCYIRLKQYGNTLDQTFVS